MNWSTGCFAQSGGSDICVQHPDVGDMSEHSRPMNKEPFTSRGIPWTGAFSGNDPDAAMPHSVGVWRDAIDTGWSRPATMTPIPEATEVAVPPAVC